MEFLGAGTGFGAQQFMYGFWRTLGGVVGGGVAGGVIGSVVWHVPLLGGLENLGNLGLDPGDENPALLLTSLPINLGFVIRGFGAQQILCGLTIGLGGVLLLVVVVLLLPGLPVSWCTSGSVDPDDDDLEDVPRRDLLE